MKDGWEIKKLGEVCEKLTDGSHNPPKGIFQSEYIMISSQNVFNDKLTYDNIRYLSEEDFIKENKRTDVSEGDVLLTIVGTIGRCAVFTGDAKISLQRSVAVIRAKNYLFPRFLMHCLIGKSEYLYDKAHGIAQKGLYLKQLSQIPIPVPPLPEQERIVSELDCINGILEKKREQIKELDALAQSIFYDMFGDPIHNEKGWEVRKLGELTNYKLSYGSGASAIPFDGNIRYVRITDINDSGKLNEEKVSPNVMDEKYLLNDGDLLFARSGATVGKTYLYNPSDGRAIYAGYLIRFIPNTEYLLPSYIFGYTKTEFYKSFIQKSAQAVAQPNINAQQYSSLDVLLPPLPLQQSFASKIEAIEKQKELIKRSIAETETLLASRMQHYFGS